MVTAATMIGTRPVPDAQPTQYGVAAATRPYNTLASLKQRVMTYATLNSIYIVHVLER